MTGQLICTTTAPLPLTVSWLLPLFSIDAELNANAAGTWWYRFAATGSGQTADETNFQVDTSAFD
jgi:hypothetical protein